jgi:hypothetical protein
MSVDPANAHELAQIAGKIGAEVSIRRLAITLGNRRLAAWIRSNGF